MANKLKSAKPKEADPDQLQQDKEETLEVKQLLKDERTHKIVGSILLLLAFVFFIAFTSYMFSWGEDQDKFSYRMLLANDIKVQNLLGTFGAFIAEIFIRHGFGIASYLICTTFFVLGINLFFGKKVFSILRNIKYLIVGLPIISVTGSVIFNGNSFPWGGAAGDMIRDWMYISIGQVGTISVLLVFILSYFIWRFNPVFKLPVKKSTLPFDENMTPVGEEISEKVEWDEASNLATGNSLKNNGAMLQELPQEEDLHQKINDLEKEEKESVPAQGDEKIVTTVNSTLAENDLPLEIKSTPEKSVEETLIPTAKNSSIKPYDPILDLRDYKYPTLDLLANHGSDKIVQDADELENNKNQIINTLKNYDIAIQKIYATVGPTVTLYEIIPAAGVRISRIKNLEDDIALSLAALGIRIIAPIPGKGTIGIEVPNAKKSIVSMKTLLSSEKFQNNNYSLPIAIGKKIDNENFIVDLTTMPHILMAGATGQGKSVGLNAILVSLLYKKHPSQLKFVLVDPKKV